jgi:hypothetical protein
MFLDLVIVIILSFLASSVLDNMEDPPNWVRIALFFGIWLLYEPLLTAFAVTPGQFIKGIRVRQERDRSKRIGVFPALVRYITKIILGWISFLSMHTFPLNVFIKNKSPGASAAFKNSRPQIAALKNSRSQITAFKDCRAQNTTLNDVVSKTKAPEIFRGSISFVSIPSYSAYS